MDATVSFRRILAARLVRASAICLPAIAAASWSACGVPGAGPIISTECFAPSGLGLGGASTFSGQSACPSLEQASEDEGFDASTPRCGQILSQPSFDGGLCCYEVGQCGSGRPFLDEGRARSADARRARGGSGDWRREGHAPHVADLAPDVRARLAAAWTADALAEHASIASFGRFALELMAVGAPGDLVAAAHRAALDEVEHARLCFSLAEAYAGEAVVPSPFPFDGSVTVSADLASIAARAVREGCVGETLGAVQAADQLARAEDACVRRALAVIVEDEARHAELSFRFVAWAMAVGGAPVRAAVERAFAETAIGPEPAGALPPEMVAHGRLDAPALWASRRRAFDEVLHPSLARLLAAA